MTYAKTSHLLSSQANEDVIKMKYLAPIRMAEFENIDSASCCVKVEDDLLTILGGCVKYFSFI